MAEIYMNGDSHISEITDSKDESAAIRDDEVILKTDTCNGEENISVLKKVNMNIENDETAETPHNEEDDDSDVSGDSGIINGSYDINDSSETFHSVEEEHAAIEYANAAFEASNSSSLSALKDDNILDKIDCEIQSEVKSEFPSVLNAINTESNENSEEKSEIDINIKTEITNEHVEIVSSEVTMTANVDDTECSSDVGSTDTHILNGHNEGTVLSDIKDTDVNLSESCVKSVDDISLTESYIKITLGDEDDGEEDNTTPDTTDISTVTTNTYSDSVIHKDNITSDDTSDKISDNSNKDIVSEITDNNTIDFSIKTSETPIVVKDSNTDNVAMEATNEVSNENMPVIPKIEITEEPFITQENISDLEATPSGIPDKEATVVDLTKSVDVIVLSDDDEDTTSSSTTSKPGIPEVIEEPNLDSVSVSADTETDLKYSESNVALDLNSSVGGTKIDNDNSVEIESVNDKYPVVEVTDEKSVVGETVDNRSLVEDGKSAGVEIIPDNKSITDDSDVPVKIIDDVNSSVESNDGLKSALIESNVVNAEDAKSVPAESIIVITDDAKILPVESNIVITDDAKSVPAESNIAITDDAKILPVESNVVIKDDVKSVPAESNIVITDDAKVLPIDSNVVITDDAKVLPVESNVVIVDDAKVLPVESSKKSELNSTAVETVDDFSYTPVGTLEEATPAIAAEEPKPDVLAESVEDKETPEDKELDILGNSLLKKKILIKGNGRHTRPLPGNLVTVRCEGKLANGTVVDKHEKLQFILSDEDVIQAFDLAVALMEDKEVATVFTDARYAYGIHGRPDLTPPIPQNASITYSIEILSIADGPDLVHMSSEERIIYGDKKRIQGNDLYGKEEYSASINAYKRGVKYLEGTDDEDVMNMKMKCLNNLSAAQLKVKAYKMAIQSLDTVLQFEPENVKALFRKGKCLEGLKKEEEALEYIKKASMLDPQNKSIVQELGRLRSRVAVTHEKEKKIYQKMFNPNKEEKISKEEEDLNWSVKLTSVIVGVLGIVAGLLWYKHR